jgi:hypothetical protein
MTMPPITMACPCGTEIEVTIECELGQIENGRQQLNFHPDYSDLWAHAWTHDELVEFEFEDVTTDVEAMHEPLPCLMCGKPAAGGCYCEEHA